MITNGFKGSILLLFLFICVVSCGPSKKEYEKLLQKNIELEEEIGTLRLAMKHYQGELEKFQNDPAKLYAEMQKFLKKKDIESVSSICNKLNKYHPESVECKKAKAALEGLMKEREAQVAVKRAKRMKAVDKLKKEYDDITGITWYYNPYFTHYNNMNKTSIYMGQDGDHIWLRLKMSYTGENWIFFEKAYLSYDGRTKEVKFDKYSDKKSDNDTRVWEWIDVPVSDELLSFLKDMDRAKDVKMRLSGKYTETRNLTRNEIEAIGDVLLAYDVLLRGVDATDDYGK